MRQMKQFHRVTLLSLLISVGLHSASTQAVEDATSPAAMMSRRRAMSLVATTLAGAAAGFRLLSPTSKKAFVERQRRLQRGNVIIVTVDGVRQQEVFGQPETEIAPGGQPDQVIAQGAFAFTHSTVGQGGVLYGDRSRGEKGARTSNNTLISLPGYQSIWSGKRRDDYWDDARTSDQTLMERLIRHEGFKPRDVATFASWDRIAFAVESIQGTSFVDAAHKLSGGPAADEELAPWSYPQYDLDSRYDRYTIAHALEHLKKKPRFLYISLLDPDEGAHLKNRRIYTAGMQQADRLIQQLTERLKEMGEYGENTSIIMTTDHGRGNGEEWKNHGNKWPESQSIWLYAQTPFTRALAERHEALSATAFKQGYEHLDVRPTIEFLLGLKPTLGPGRGRVLYEVTGGN